MKKQKIGFLVAGGLVFLSLGIANIGAGLPVGKSFSLNDISLPFEQKPPPEAKIREISDVQKAKLYLFEKLNYDYKSYKLLSRIIECESKWDFNVVNKKTGDFGLFQINLRSWDNKAKELGLDYKGNWVDNIDMGLYIYRNNGTKPWNWSKKCWKN